MKIHLIPLLCAVLVGSAACAPGLDDPARFEDAGACGDVQTEIFWNRCALSGCHIASDPTGGLSLLTDGIAHRLVGVESTTCLGELLIDPVDPEQSVLLRRVSPEPHCGSERVSRMPLVGFTLDDGELDCVRAWVHALAAEYRDEAAQDGSGS